MHLRCLLFVPSVRPDRYVKALGAGGDGIIIDLEDAVAQQEKGRGREELVRFLAEAAESDRCRTAVRINSLGTADGLRDILALLDSPHQPAMLVLPKVGSAGELAQVKSLFGGQCPPLVALIETPAALEALSAIAAFPGLAGVAFGGADYAAAMGCAMSWEGLFHARCRIATAAAAAGIPAIDVPCLDLGRESGPATLEAECLKVRELGFVGKLCIHPAQVATVRKAFTASAEAIARARAIVAAYDQAGGSVCEVAGEMVDVPVYLAAKRLLAANG